MEIKTQSRLYEPDKLVEKDIPKRIDAEVKEIKNGKLGDLIPAEVLAKWNNADPESSAIEIVAECSDGSIRRRTLQLPIENEIHPNSNLAKWKRNYGGYPAVGQKIYLLADVNGFYQFDV